MIKKNLPGILMGAFFLFIPVLSFAIDVQVGIIEEIQGKVTITRSGTVISSPEIGDSIEDYDLIKTGSDGLLIIGLCKNTGMSGTLLIKPQSVFTVQMTILNSKPATEGNVLAGSIGVKVKKLSGEPVLRIRTGDVVMGVRGTEFVVSVSITDALLVTCSEGRVVCTTSEGMGLEIVPGEVVIKKSDEPMKKVPVAVSSLEDFQKQWYAEEISAFKANSIKVLDKYASMYIRYSKEFRTATDALLKDPVFLKWKKEDIKNIIPSSQDVQVMKEKSSIVPKLMEIRRILFLFERIYYRLEEVESYIPQTSMNSKLSNGQQVKDFMHQVAKERPDLEQRTAAYRYALRLYIQRNDGKEPVSIGEGDDSFFNESIDSFFTE